MKSTRIHFTIAWKNVKFYVYEKIIVRRIVQIGGLINNQ